jgi:flagellar assembly protein FliH
VSGEGELDDVRTVRFDRPLVDLPSWADPRLARQLADAARTARERGLAEGYAAGWAQGRRAAAETARAEATARAEREKATRRQVAARAQTLLAALAQTARTLTEQVTPAWDELVEVLLSGSLQIAAACLARELAATDTEALEAARAALRLLPSTEAVALHLHPDDAALLGEEAALPDGVTIVPDVGVAAGTVTARTPLQSLPVDLSAGLRAAEEVLRP